MRSASDEPEPTDLSNPAPAPAASSVSLLMGLTWALAGLRLRFPLEDVVAFGIAIS